ncbi:UNVERIFIED_CONTAM: hypothetical protein GTU68_000665 [Idotea baltica]|nr:hypothetical protein [Idotea baltica]
MEVVRPTFGMLDYCIFAIVLIVSIGIGIRMHFTGSASPEAYLMGNRSFGPYPVAVSLLSSFISAIGVLGYSGEAYAYGTQMFMFVIGISLGIVAAEIIFLPVIYSLKLTSVNEYPEIRFKSSCLRTCLSFISVIQGLLYMAVCLYAPTIALQSVTPISSQTYIFILGSICTFYSTIGGIRAIVWTDVFQLSVMFLGLCLVIFIGCWEIGSLKKVFEIAYEGGRLNIFNMDPSLTVRHNFYNTIGFGFFFYSSAYGVTQMNVQRISSVRTMQDAKTVLRWNILGSFLIHVLIFFGGVMAYATYNGCDPLTLGKIKRKEEILTYFVIDRLQFIPGLPGVFVAVILGGTLSSLSSIISAQVAMLWKDILIKFKYFANASPQRATIYIKCLSLANGCTIMGVAFLVSKAKNLVQLSYTFLGITHGCMYGVFLLGFLFPKCNIKGVWTGFIISTMFIAWISTGSFIYGKNADYLKLNADNCSATSFVTNAPNSTLESEIYLSIPQEALNKDVSSEEGFVLLNLYRISYTLYPVIGPIICVIVGLIVSYLTGNEKLENVSSELITPLVRKWYWKKQELEEIYHVKDSPL